jgi:hypothetical protein
VSLGRLSDKIKGNFRMVLKVIDFDIVDKVDLFHCIVVGFYCSGDGSLMPIVVKLTS